MDADAMHPSRFFRCSDLNGQPLRVTIAGVRKEDVGNGESKWALTFKDVTKALIINKTNSKAIQKLFGKETDGWRGKEILLVPAVVDFKGEEVDAVRIRAVPQRKPAEEPPFDDPIEF